MCPKNSDAKNIVVTTTELVRISYPVNLANLQFFGIDLAILNRIRHVVIEIQIFSRPLLENRSFQYIWQYSISQLAKVTTYAARLLFTFLMT